MDKKAQGISMNVIIIAAIALLVLVILSIIFMGRMGTWGVQVGDCEAKGYSCRDRCLDTEKEAPLWKCSKEKVQMGMSACCYTPEK